MKAAEHRQPFGVSFLSFQTWAVCVPVAVVGCYSLTPITLRKKVMSLSLSQGPASRAPGRGFTATSRSREPEAAPTSEGLASSVWQLQ